MKEGRLSTMIGFSFMLLLMGVCGWAVIEIPESKPYLSYPDKSSIVMNTRDRMAEQTFLYNLEMQRRSTQGGR